MIVNLEEVLSLSNLDFGNKALNLSKLHNAGYAVPRGISISTDEHISYLSNLSSKNPNPDFRSGFKNSISELLEKIDSPLYSIRSSANVEDSCSKSFAGQFKTVLNRSIEQVIPSIRVVYDSARSLSRGYTGYKINVEMGILIQEMIHGDYAGVMFTYDLINNSAETLMLELSKRNCENVVSGLSNPSLYVINKKTGEIELYNPGSENVKLSESEAIKLAAFGCGIEELFGRPQDVELISGVGRLYALQSRDITTLPSSL